jgi:hypothetical protein
MVLMMLPNRKSAVKKNTSVTAVGEVARVGKILPSLDLVIYPS